MFCSVLVSTETHIAFIKHTSVRDLCGLETATVCPTIFSDADSVMKMMEKEKDEFLPDVWKLSDQNSHLHLDGGDVLQLDYL